MHNPPPHHNAGNNESSLSIFQGQLGSASDARYKTLNYEEWRHIMFYLLTNLSEVGPYMGEFHHQFWRRSRPPTPKELDALLKNGAGNSQPDFISWFKQNVISNAQPAFISWFE